MRIFITSLRFHPYRPSSKLVARKIILSLKTRISRTVLFILSAAMQELFVRILQKSMSEELKAAIDIEGMNYKMSDSYEGLLLRARGLNEKLLVKRIHYR